MSRLHQPVGTHRQLQRPAADVHDDGAPDPEIEVREGGAKREPRLLLAVQHADLQSGLPSDPLEEHAAIRASRTALVATASMRAAPICLASVAMRWRASTDCCIASSLEETALVKARTESRGGLHFVDDPDGARRRDVGNDLPDGIRSDVDGGEAEGMGLGAPP